ncbi:DegT/DnrJ/EryC1/StrS family aminotransferase [Streptomyces sp. NPDC097619]|uniref:DegT/DnrJ/EryC1/StrS family aminotransferase n=1 Tax=Streptomyces sp. NPDC097619 TaxID=3157228 RepID=UPI0033246E47
MTLTDQFTDALTGSALTAGTAGATADGTDGRTDGRTAGRGLSGGSRPVAADGLPALQHLPVPPPLDLPYAPPGPTEEERTLMLRAFREVATDPDRTVVLGRRTGELERRLRERARVAEVTACGSGTGALILALRTLGAGPGDEVIVPAFGAEPLASSVLAVGATPVFADVDPVTMVLDPADTERRITPRTRVVVPAHTFQSVADMPALVELAARRGVSLLEDSAVAMGASLHGSAAGSWGDIGLYSFFPVKPFGMVGEGAVLLTDDAELAAAVRRVRDHGQDPAEPGVHHELGIDSRFDEVQAAYQLARLDTLDDRLAARRAVVDHYEEALAPLRSRGLLLPEQGPGISPCLYVYAVQHERRDELAAHLAGHGVGTRVYYPLPLHRLPQFARYAPAPHHLPGAEAASSRHLALPLHHHMTQSEAWQVTEAIRSFFA